MCVSVFNGQKAASSSNDKETQQNQLLMDTVNVSLDYQRSEERMTGDKDQLLNVVNNLIENAVKYSGDIVNIHLLCQDTEQGEVLISVSDNGIGLGLSYVDMIVKAHSVNPPMNKIQIENGKEDKDTVCR